MYLNMLAVLSFCSASFKQRVVMCGLSDPGARDKLAGDLLEESILLSLRLGWTIQANLACSAWMPLVLGARRLGKQYAVTGA